MSKEVNPVLTSLWLGIAIILVWAAVGFYMERQAQPVPPAPALGQLKAPEWCWSESLADTGLGSSGPCKQE